MTIAACALLVGTTLASGGYITSVTDSNSAAPVTDGVTTQRENDKDGAVVLFGEDVFVFTDRTHEYNGARYRSADGVLDKNGDTIVGLPSYLIGGEYVSTLNNNRVVTNFGINVTVSQDVVAYLLIDNRTGDNISTNPPTLGSGGTGIMSWVADDGWHLYNTGIIPNAVADYVGIDEGGTPADWSKRTHLTTVGAGQDVVQFSSVYRRFYSAGETITLKEQNAGKITMYGLVVTPEPATVGLLALGALALASYRRRHG